MATNTSPDPDRLDAAIDAVVERLTTGDLGPDFRARVLTRVDHGGGRRIASLMPAAVTAAVVVLALVAGGVALRPRDGRPAESVPVAAPPAAPARAARVEPPAPPVPAAAPATPVTTARPATRPAESQLAIFAEPSAPVPQTVHVAALDAVAPIATEPIAPESVRAGDILVSPIDLDPILVPPIGSQPPAAVQE